MKKKKCRACGHAKHELVTMAQQKGDAIIFGFCPHVARFREEKRQAAQRKQKISARECSNHGCERPAAPGRRRCEVHLNEREADRETRTSLGLCMFHGCQEKRTSGQLCTKHRIMIRDSGKRTRRDHFFVRKAASFNSHQHDGRGGSITGQQLAHKWHQQKGRCALTGRLLTRENAWIDHILPVTRGGNHDISNLQWTIRNANFAKGNMTEKEFVQLCSDVIKKVD